MICNYFKKRREKQEKLNSLLDDVSDLKNLVGTINEDQKEMYLLLNETAQRKTDTQQNRDYQENKLSDYLLDFDDSCIEEYIALQKKADKSSKIKKILLGVFIVLISALSFLVSFETLKDSVNIFMLDILSTHNITIKNFTYYLIIISIILPLTMRIFFVIFSPPINKKSRNCIFDFSVLIIIVLTCSLSKFLIPLISFEFHSIPIVIILLIIVSYIILVNIEKYSIYSNFVKDTDKKKFLWGIGDFNSSKGYKNELLSNSYSNNSSNISYIGIRNKNISDDEKIHKITLLDWATHRIRRKYFIEFSNWNNLSLTIYITIFTYIIYLFYIYLDSNSKVLLIYIISILIIRLLSRSYEIILSFYKDIVSINSNFLYLYDKKKQEHISYYINNIKYSLIRSPGRLSLAIHSLIEIIIVCSGIYFFMDCYNANTNILYSPDSNDNNLKPSNYQIDNGHTLDTPLKALLYSASLGVFNISFDSTKGLIWSFIHVTQVLSSVILILLSIAQYLGSDKELSPKEAEFYKKYHEKDNEQKDNKK